MPQPLFPLVRPMLFAVLVATSLAPPAVARADQAPMPPGSREMLDEAAKRMVEAFQLILKAIPQYDMPEVLPNGDILIRRIPPGQHRHESPETPPGQDKT